MKNTPIIIIGAGRSGTNILRDSICALRGFETWPCDEINYIWRHGNVGHPTDRFTDAEARNSVRTYITEEFEKLERKTGANYVVEKTCANSLKIPFINSIFPDARFIYLVRNGYDVASSAKQRWTASLELKYIFAKAKYIPFADIPYYGWRYLGNRLKKLFSKENRLAFWGPIYPGMMEDLKTHSLLQVCSKQWRECAVTAYKDLSALDKSRVHCLTYEQFVSDPVAEMKKVMQFIGEDFSDDELASAISDVSPRSIGNYRKYISQEELDSIADLIEPTMDSIHKRIHNDSVSKVS